MDIVDMIEQLPLVRAVRSHTKTMSGEVRATFDHSGTSLRRDFDDNGIDMRHPVNRYIALLTLDALVTTFEEVRETMDMQECVAMLGQLIIEMESAL